MDTLEAKAAVDRCDMNVGRAHSLLSRLDVTAGRDQELFAEILRSRIDVELDLRNYFAAAVDGS